jgi:transcriptional regulator with XRE-family HTH domain
MKMLSTNISFGEYVTIKRRANGITQKDVADALGVTTVYICDIEKNRRYPPTKGEALLKLVNILKLNDDEQFILYDLVGQDKKCVSPDLSEYIMSSVTIRSALRIAKDKATNDDWKLFIENLNKKQE